MPFIRTQNAIVLRDGIHEQVRLLGCLFDGQTKDLFGLILLESFLIGKIGQQCGLLNGALLRMRGQIEVLPAQSLRDHIFRILLLQILRHLGMLALQVVQKALDASRAVFGLLILTGQTLARVHIFDVQVNFVVVLEFIEVDTESLGFSFALGPVDPLLLAGRALFPVDFVCF